ncbi:serine hydrolase domain-containing protein [Alteribacter populi]|uniref:serine hydrolase domain-containing protein n=1 Tax=Alteribacter populi TaxID=2011011 RepID=UPI000BBA9015|nr:serine hydrolase [Alteribacter populi]
MLNEKVNETLKKTDFSGTVLLRAESDTVYSGASGYANRSDRLRINLETRFGIASGCKLFTAIAICQLVEKGDLTLQTRLNSCLDFDFPHFDDAITVHHLLTHTSGVPDYFDEEVMDDFEELWQQTPMYALRNLEGFLTLFQNEKMKFTPGSRFHYNNAGFVLLGLIVEKISGQVFSDYVEQHIFKKAAMEESGYFSFDQLPTNTALGYIEKEDGTWKTNVYSLPVKGGADGGAFTTVLDMIKCWDALFYNQLLCKEMTETLLSPHRSVDEENSYGYGVWITRKNDQIYKYHVMGYDPGVSFHSSYYPNSKHTLVVASNKSTGAYEVVEVIEEQLKE